MKTNASDFIAFVTEQIGAEAGDVCEATLSQKYKEI